MLSSLVWEIVTGDSRPYHHNPFAYEVNICLTHKSRNQDDSVQLEFLIELGFFFSPQKGLATSLFNITGGTILPDSLYLFFSLGRHTCS